MPEYRWCVGCFDIVGCFRIVIKEFPMRARGAFPAPRWRVAWSPEYDLAVARAAVSDALEFGGKDTSTPWENPRTGARGTITRIAAAYNQDGNICQDFLASYVSEGSEA